MALIYQPKEGDVLICDFAGFVEPEMVKTRPVIILARNRLNSKLVTVIPLSTTKPHTIQAHHHELSVNPLPDKTTTVCWAKCDMVATVSISRLDRIKTMTATGRSYIVGKVPPADFQVVKQCVVAALHLGNAFEMPGEPK
jgi:uncharacterized protein YifN (PemK superfamily)